MSQADAQDSLTRLQETIAQLQAIATSLATEEVMLSEVALSNLVAETANLVVTPETTTAVEAPIADAVENAEDADDAWDSEIFEAEVPVPPSPSVAQPTSRSVPPMKRRPARPWWQTQKVIVGAISLAIAVIFIWRITTKMPEPEIVAEQSGESSTPIETVIMEEPTVIDGDKPEPEPELSAPVEITPEAIAPDSEFPDSEFIVKPKPEPPAPLTPEQRLVAAIQVQVNDLTQPYGDNLVRGVEANFDKGILSITVGDAWYLLKAGLQDRLGAEVLELSQLLDFQKLRIKDVAGHFVAREPVVGDALVIYRRYQDFSDLETAS